MGTVSMIRTRQSLGSQIRDALDDLVARGVIVGWSLECDGPGAIRYVLEDARMFAYYSPGNCAAMLNEVGYDVYFGKV